MAIRTIFTVAEDSARGERLGWLEFVRDYGTIGGTLLRHYFPTLTPELETHLLAVFQRARAHDNAWFHSLKFTNEREFLMAFRELVFAYGREEARVPGPEISLEQMAEIMKGLSVMERELLWLFVKGYKAEQIAPIMMNAAATATAVKTVADERLARILPGASADAFNVSARVLIEAAEKKKTEQCLPIKTFNNIVNGQISWRERELAEEHIRDCFHCVDRFTSFQEMIRLRIDSKPLPEEQAENMVARLGLQPKKAKGMLARLLKSG